jgi:hypothetical protein
MSNTKRLMQKRLLNLTSELVHSIDNVNSYNIHITLEKLQRGINSIKYDFTIK